MVIRRYKMASSSLQSLGAEREWGKQFFHHNLEVTQAVGWLLSVVIWQMIDKNKQSTRNAIVTRRKVSWEPFGRRPSTSPHKHRQDCPAILSIHFSFCMIVWWWEAIVRFVYCGFSRCVMWRLLSEKQTGSLH